MNISDAEEYESSPTFPVKKQRRTKKQTEGYFNAQFSAHALSVFAGTHRCSSDEDVMLVTTLGSCIAVCIHDPITRTGGMNHFMMPDVPRHVLGSHLLYDNAARYGLAAMEQLINAMMKQGSLKVDMRFKIFGGGNVIKSVTNIGSANTKFARAFLKNEGYNIVSEDTGGNLGRRIHFFPASGKAMRRFLKRSSDITEIRKEEDIYRKTIKDSVDESEVLLF